MDFLLSHQMETLDNIPFPLKLYNLLESLTPPENAVDVCVVVGWLHHGKSFCIYNLVKFEEEILPKYFKHARMSSFQRQLNLYGFRRISVNEEIRGSYYHCSFQRGRVDLLPEVRRITSKNTQQEKPKVSQYRMHLNNCSVPETLMKSEPIATSCISEDTSKHYQMPLQPIQKLFIQSQVMYDFGPPPQLSQPLPSHMIRMKAPTQFASYKPTKNVHVQNELQAMTSNNKSTPEAAESIQQIFMSQMRQNSEDDFYRIAPSHPTPVMSYNMQSKSRKTMYDTSAGNDVVASKRSRNWNVEDNRIPTSIFFPVPSVKKLEPIRLSQSMLNLIADETSDYSSKYSDVKSTASTDRESVNSSLINQNTCDNQVPFWGYFDRALDQEERFVPAISSSSCPSYNIEHSSSVHYPPLNPVVMPSNTNDFGLMVRSESLDLADFPSLLLDRNESFLFTDLDFGLENH